MSKENHQFELSFLLYLHNWKTFKNTIFVYNNTMLDYDDILSTDSRSIWKNKEGDCVL